jgi:hypothetical protein
MLGYAMDDILGQHLHDLVHLDPCDPNALPEDACPKCGATRTHWPVRLADQVLWRRDGTSLQVDYWVYPVCRRGFARARS